jgi:hypothetical protein
MKCTGIGVVVERRMGEAQSGATPIPMANARGRLRTDSLERRAKLAAPMNAASVVNTRKRAAPATRFSKQKRPPNPTPMKSERGPTTMPAVKPLMKAPMMWMVVGCDGGVPIAVVGRV